MKRNTSRQTTRSTFFKNNITPVFLAAATKSDLDSFFRFVSHYVLRENAGSAGEVEDSMPNNIERRPTPAG